MKSSEEYVPSTKQKALAFGVHVYTASGAIFAVLALQAIFAKQFHLAYFYNFIAVVIDSSDGVFARKFQVKKVLPDINGRTLDDIVDFVNYTFLPMILLIHLNILPGPAWLWVCFPIMASLFAFADEGVKEEDEGFFVGFPSYWNFFVLYADLVFFKTFGSWFTLIFMLVLTAMNVMPLRFVYPSMAKRWQAFFVWGAIIWVLPFLYLIYAYHKAPPWVAWLSLTYPMLYMILSMYLDFDSRRKKKQAASG